MQGFIGAPGVMTFYCVTPATWRPELVTFLTSVVSAMPGTVGVTIESSGDIIDDVTGALTGTWSAGTDVTLNGVGASAYAAPVGECFTWLTDTVADGKRLRGRTFLVPLRGDNFEGNGTISEGTSTAHRAAAATLNAASPGQFLIWHRPRAASLPGVLPVVTARAGSSGPVTGFRVSDKAAVLRSRRD